MKIFGHLELFWWNARVFEQIKHLCDTNTNSFLIAEELIADFVLYHQNFFIDPRLINYAF